MIATHESVAVVHAPVVHVVGGPNGAGKTTFAREFLPAEGILEFLNADLLAAGLSPLQPQAVAIHAARLLLNRWRDLVRAGTDFAFESTLSGRTYATMLCAARDAGYTVRLSYLWLPSAEFSWRRVRQRVRKGGHEVPAVDVHRRFLPSLRNFFSLYLPLADEALLFQAAFRPPRLVASWKKGNLMVSDPQIYARVQTQAASAAATSDSLCRKGFEGDATGSTHGGA